MNRQSVVLIVDDIPKNVQLVAPASETTGI